MNPSYISDLKRNVYGDDYACVHPIQSTGQQDNKSPTYIFLSLSTLKRLQNMDDNNMPCFYYLDLYFFHYDDAHLQKDDDSSCPSIFFPNESANPDNTQKSNKDIKMTQLMIRMKDSIFLFIFSKFSEYFLPCMSRMCFSFTIQLLE